MRPALPALAALVTLACGDDGGASATDDSQQSASGGCVWKDGACAPP